MKTNYDKMVLFIYEILVYYINNIKNHVYT